METDCTSSSSPAEPAVGFNASSFVAVAGSSDSAASPWSRWPRPGRKPLANRKLAREGGDPLAEKRRTEGIPTFAEAAIACAGTEAGRLARTASPPRVDVQPEAVRLPAHRQDAGLRGHQRRSCLRSSPLSGIGRPPAPRRVRQRLRAVLEWARSHGVQDRQPLRPDRTGPGSSA